LFAYSVIAKTLHRKLQPYTRLFVTVSATIPTVSSTVL